MTRPSLNTGPLGIAFALLLVGALYLATAHSWRQSALFLVGAGAGMVLYHAAFGFTSSWRAFIAEGRGDGLRAQMLMLAITSAVFFPAIAAGSLLGQPVRGLIAPVGLSVAVGAFIFGVGMQLGGGCASGTLYTAGGGSVRMLVTLAAFIAGSVLGTLHMPIWEHMPSFGSLAFVPMYGAPVALAMNLAAFGAIAGVSVLVERQVNGGMLRRDPSALRARSWLRGPWPLVAGAVGLAAVNIATLVLAGRPWGVTAALALWGSKALQATGVDVASWPYWQVRSAELRASVLADVTSVMNFGIIIGAFAAAGLAGRFAPAWRVPLRSLAAAILGGLMLGYGARIAYGCNIGAYFSGIASSSLHGWLWFAAALAGNVLGTRLRPLFGLR
ncbi:MAG: YeeE/YedE family protein [Vicinamibacterales bacterium]